MRNCANHFTEFRPLTEDKAFNEGLMRGKTRTATRFSKEQVWNRESTQNKGTEDTSGKDTPQRGLLRNKTKTPTKGRQKRWIEDEHIIKLLHAFYTPLGIQKCPTQPLRF